MSRTLRTIKAFAVAAVMVGSVMPAIAASPAQPGNPAPDFSLRSADGPNLRLSEYRSGVVVLTFWSNWCGKCADIAPLLNELTAQHADADLQVLAVDVDGKAGEARELSSGIALQYPLLLDTRQRVSRLYDLKRLPYTVVIDREGKVRHVHSGLKGDAAAELRREVAALVAE